MELSIKEQLMADMKTAMKAKEEGRRPFGIRRYPYGTGAYSSGRN